MEDGTDNIESCPVGNDSHLPDGTKVDRRTLTDAKPYRKVLLDNYGELWLFRIWEGGHSHFAVEKAEQCWKFSLEYSARSKFTRELRRQGGTV